MANFTAKKPRPPLNKRSNTPYATSSHSFIISPLINGVLVAHSYISDQMLAEFAAASVVFAKAIPGAQEDKCYLHDQIENGLTLSMFTGSIEAILKESHSNVFSYYSRCLDSGHKHFVWSGPSFMIFPRTDDIISFIPLATTGEALDLPGHNIYSIDLDHDVTPANTIASNGKRCDPGDDADPIDDHPKKQKR
jgi:hypothetical protein